MITGILIGIVIGFIVGVIICLLWIDRKQSERAKELGEFLNESKIDIDVIRSFESI